MNKIILTCIINCSKPVIKRKSKQQQEETDCFWRNKENDNRFLRYNASENRWNNIYKGLKFKKIGTHLLYIIEHFQTNKWRNIPILHKPPYTLLINIYESFSIPLTYFISLLIYFLLSVNLTMTSVLWTEFCPPEFIF